MKIIVTIAACLAFAGAALAASNFASLTYYQADSSSPPTPLTVGAALVNSQNLPARQITVTVSDYSDGGNLGTASTDDDYLRGFTLLAWRKVGPGQLLTATDAGWTRQPELDVSYAANTAALANSTNPVINLQASRAWSVTLAGQIVTMTCSGGSDGGLGGTSGSTNNNCVTTYVGNGSGKLPEYAKGSQLYYEGTANGVLGLDGGAKPFLITIDTVF